MTEPNVNDLIGLDTYQAVSHIYKMLLNSLDPTTTSGLKDPTMTNEEFYRGINETIVHGIAICISMCYENIDESHVKTLDEYFGQITSFNNIECLEEMDAKEKRKQIRNCFAHGHYKSFGSEEGYLAGIYIDNGKVKGVIPYSDLYNLKNTFQYMASADGVSNKNTFCIFYGVGLEKARDRETLKQALEKLKYYYFVGTKGEDNIEEVLEKIRFTRIGEKEEEFRNMTIKLNAMRERGINHIDLQEKKLTEEEQQQVIDLIEQRKYKMLSLLDLAYPHLKERILLEAAREVSLNDQICPYDVEIYPLLCLILSKGDALDDKFAELALKYGMERPFVFTKMVLQNGFFVFDYLREMNERHGETLFNYIDFDLTGLEMQSFNNEKLVRAIDPKQLIQDEIISSEKRVTKLMAANEKLEESRQKIENPQNRNPKKEEILIGIGKSTAINNGKISEELEKQETKKEELENCTAQPYTDCRHLFRHLRNAFAHRRYTVEYGDAIKKDNYHGIRFHFEDYDEIKNETGQKVGERLAFTLDCDAKSLCRLLREIDVRVVTTLKAQPSLTENKNSTSKK